MGRAVWEDRKRFNHDFFDWLTPRYTLSNYSPFGLSPTMFIKTLQLMATPEQQEKWLTPALEGKMNGAYIQTELAHGSFVRGIETTATFDPATDCFLLHSPTLTSIKFWPGSMAFSASHGIVMARLITNGKDRGVHPFFVQLRDIPTGNPIPGIELGDIGIKMNHNQNDNGYVRFERVSIPRENMLMAQASVSRDGRFAKKMGVHDKSAYATMIVTRSKMTWVNAIQLAAAATIAIRYSTVRVQGHLPYSENQIEIPLIGFKTQHYRLLTLTAKAYAILFVSRHCDTTLQDFERRADRGDFSSMTSTHALTSGVKAWSSAMAAEGTEDARRACGGQGYLVSSGLPQLAQTSAMMCTAEGDTQVLLLQLARYLMKFPGSFEPLPGDLRYLKAPYISRCADANFVSPADASTQSLIFRHRAQRLIGKAARNLRNEAAQGRSKAEAWNKHAMALMSAARAHIEYLVLQNFIQATAGIEDKKIADVLNKLRSVFALSTITNPQSEDALSFVEDGFLVEGQLDQIRETLNHLLDELVPQAIGLTDAWDFTDAGLGSAIGQKDGNVYERLMEWTRQVPINQKVWRNRGVHGEAWGEYIRPSL